MAGLPPDGQILIQQIDGRVVIFDRYTEEEYHEFDPTDPNMTAIMQGHIWHDERLTPEQRCYAIFWSGYFHAYAGGRLGNPHD